MLISYQLVKSLAVLLICCAYVLNIFYICRMYELEVVAVDNLYIHIHTYRERVQILISPLK